MMSVQANAAPPEEEDRRMEALLEGEDDTAVSSTNADVRVRTGWDEAEDVYDKVHKVWV